ncbi:MAG: aminotransferase class V-fold PLP-dependent enzyme [Candidatus Bilamarchaeum sp.]|jgi:cysteine desulfurase/selenocysteine lyase
MSFDIDQVRRDFPILSKKDLIYLDSASTSQKPLSVIETIFDFYCNQNSNVARGLYTLAEEATFEFESIREKTSKFINAKDSNEIIFTRGTTESINLIMRSYGEKFIKKGDKIVTSVMEHHSNFVPWQQLAKTKGAIFQAADITEYGELDLSDLEKKSKDARIVSISGASNVLGTINDIKKISSIAHENGAICVIDGAQSVPSLETDVKKLDCDFLAFSSHKMLGPFGLGILYGKEDLLSKSDPFLYGSEMIREVSIASSQWNDLPHKFEPGTPPVAEVIGFGAALDYLNKLKMENIRKHELSITKYLLKRLLEVKGLSILGPLKAEKRVSLASFTIDGIHPHDVAAILAELGIAIRSGHHCAMPLHNSLGVNASNRASLYVYNKTSEIDKLIEGLEKTKKIFE